MHVKLVQGFAAIWLVLFVASFAMFVIAEPTGDGFAGDLNRISAFMTWQGVAFLLAVGAALGTYYAPAQRGGKQLKLIGYSPLVVSVAVLAMLVAMIGYTVLLEPKIS